MDGDWLAQQFEEHRSRLRAVAYRMLGSLSEAEDAVQESWLRVSRADTGGIENMGGWLTTVVSRVCLNLLRARAQRREQSLETHVPDPIVTLEGQSNPEQELLLADSVGLALLVVLETLEPAERLAFVLHDTFAVPFDEIAPIVGRTPAAARQLASRARRRVRGAATGWGAVAWRWSAHWAERSPTRMARRSWSSDSKARTVGPWAARESSAVPPACTGSGGSASGPRSLRPQRERRKQGAQ
jgi:RNA polymerase sigma factor (sigma-70 family)